MSLIGNRKKNRKKKVDDSDSTTKTVQTVKPFNFGGGSYYKNQSNRSKGGLSATNGAFFV